KNASPGEPEEPEEPSEATTISVPVVKAVPQFAEDGETPVIGEDGQQVVEYESAYMDFHQIAHLDGDWNNVDNVAQMLQFMAAVSDHGMAVMDRDGIPSTAANAVNDLKEIVAALGDPEREDAWRDPSAWSAIGDNPELQERINGLRREIVQLATKEAFSHKDPATAAEATAEHIDKLADEQKLNPDSVREMAVGIDYALRIQGNRYIAHVLGPTAPVRHQSGGPNGRISDAWSPEAELERARGVAEEGDHLKKLLERAQKAAKAAEPGVRLGIAKQDEPKLSDKLAGALSAVQEAERVAGQMLATQDLKDRVILAADMNAKIEAARTMLLDTLPQVDKKVFAALDISSYEDRVAAIIAATQRNEDVETVLDGPALGMPDAPQTVEQPVATAEPAPTPDAPRTAEQPAGTAEPSMGSDVTEPTNVVNEPQVPTEPVPSAEPAAPDGVPVVTPVPVSGEVPEPEIAEKQIPLPGAETPVVIREPEAAEVKPVTPVEDVTLEEPTDGGEAVVEPESGQPPAPTEPSAADLTVPTDAPSPGAEPPLAVMVPVEEGQLDGWVETAPGVWNPDPEATAPSFGIPTVEILHGPEYGANVRIISVGPANLDPQAPIADDTPVLHAWEFPRDTDPRVVVEGARISTEAKLARAIEVRDSTEGRRVLGEEDLATYAEEVGASRTEQGYQLVDGTAVTGAELLNQLARDGRAVENNGVYTVADGVSDEDYVKRVTTAAASAEVYDRALTALAPQEGGDEEPSLAIRQQLRAFSEVASSAPDHLDLRQHVELSAEDQEKVRRAEAAMAKLPLSATEFAAAHALVANEFNRPIDEAAATLAKISEAFEALAEGQEPSPDERAAAAERRDVLTGQLNTIDEFAERLQDVLPEDETAAQEAFRRTNQAAAKVLNNDGEIEVEGEEQDEETEQLREGAGLSPAEHAAVREMLNVNVAPLPVDSRDLYSHMLTDPARTDVPLAGVDFPVQGYDPQRGEEMRGRGASEEGTTALHDLTSTAGVLASGSAEPQDVAQAVQDAKFAADGFAEDLMRRTDEMAAIDVNAEGGPEQLTAAMDEWWQKLDAWQQAGEYTADQFPSTRKDYRQSSQLIGLAGDAAQEWVNQGTAPEPFQGEESVADATTAAAETAATVRQLTEGAIAAHPLNRLGSASGGPQPMPPNVVVEEGEPDRTSSVQNLENAMKGVGKQGGEVGVTVSQEAEAGTETVEQGHLEGLSAAEVGRYATYKQGVDEAAARAEELRQQAQVGAESGPASDPDEGGYQQAPPVEEPAVTTGQTQAEPLPTPAGPPTAQPPIPPRPAMPPAPAGTHPPQGAGANEMDQGRSGRRRRARRGGLSALRWLLGRDDGAQKGRPRR
ncbi:MAG: hypothetical protein HOQ05_11165, partial [Corynebacteriales bacterium]|nr:hypothetical protein [Mycobacteriales bacterium]